ncbi:hypothetical protein OPIT5_25700 [Opitutaceae bacterium TAV5]|nr:hypothetical protein OPIT5_25700 [Opitutaceae bacterium TAV5]
MSSPPAAASRARSFWERAALRLAVRINLVAWFDRFAPLAFGVATAAALAAFALRRLGQPLSWLWLGLAAGLLAAAGFAGWRARQAGNFFRRGDARALLEYRLQLDSTLSAAAAGMAAWPAPRAVPACVRWRSPARFGWGAAAFALLAAGLWLPVPAPDSGVRFTPEKPPALARTEAWLEELAKLDVAEPKAVEELAERARELARRSPDRQYSHSALEAADTLREQTAEAIGSFGRDLENFAAALAPFEQNALAPLDSAQLAAAESRLDTALRGLREGALTPNAELLGQLASLDLSKIRQLTPEELARLRKRLAEAGDKVCGVCMNPGGGEGDKEGDALLLLVSAQGSGTGDVSRGPGEVPLSFSYDESAAGPGRMETVKNTDMERAALGDRLGVETGEHAVDPARAAGPTSAGAVAGPAAGGDVVWIDTLTPAERAALAEFFK